MILYHFTREIFLPGIGERGLEPGVSDDEFQALLTFNNPVVWLTTSKSTPRWLTKYHPDAYCLTVRIEQSKRLAHWQTWLAARSADVVMDGKPQTMHGADVLAKLAADDEAGKVFLEECPAFYIYLGVVQPHRIVEAAKVDWVADDEAQLREHQARLA